jgi:tetratricopeptide (TPR) repeat protein
MPASARLALVCALFLVLSSSSAAPLQAQSLLDGAPFSADPRLLLAAAEKIDAKDQQVVYLLDEATFSFEAGGRSRSVWHEIKRVATKDGVNDSGTAMAYWAPWYDEKPVITARVITKDGTVQMLDAKAIVESTAEMEQDIFSDERVLRAPLPGVAAGSVIETVITIEGRGAIASGGRFGIFNFGGSEAVEHSRLTLDSAPGIVPRLVNKANIEPRRVEQNGRTLLVFEKGHSDAIENEEGYLPSDEMNVPYVAFSTGTSWQEMAHDYSAIVDKQIGNDDLKGVVKAAAGNATEPAAVAANLLHYIDANIRYAGVEVGDGSIVPRPPKSVLGQKYGDCKDKATLLVALLRASGISAHVALVDADTGFDTIAELPGISHFNHAIVVIDPRNPGEPALWVDPTDEFARPGELPIEDQGRLALIAGDSTAALSRTPEAPSTANRYRETRTFTLPEDGKAHVVEVTEGTWSEDAILRRGYAGSDRKKYAEDLQKYAIDYFATTKLDKFDIGDPHDFSKPFQLTLNIAKSRSGIVFNGEGDVLIPTYGIASALPKLLRDHEEKSAEAENAKPEKKRKHDFVFYRPAVKEWTYTIVPAQGFAARTLPPNETKKLGSVTLTSEYRTNADGTVVAKLILDSGKRRLTPSEFDETRIAVSKLARQDGLHIGFDSIGQKKLSSGDIRGALAEFRKLAIQHPKEAQHHIELSRALLAGGLGEAARAEARLAITIEPASASAHAMLATVLEHDLLGRLHRKGEDLPGAIAALRKSKQIDPNEITVRARLADLLTYGTDGYKFGKDAPLAQAADEYRALLKDFGDAAQGYQPPLMLALTHAGRYDEVKELIKTESDVQQRDLFLILTTVVTTGVEDAKRVLDSFDVSKRRTYAAGVGQTMMSMRRYPEAAAMFDVAAQGSENGAAILALVKVLKRTQPFEKVLDDSPKSMVIKVLDAAMSGDKARMKAVFLPELDAISKDKKQTFSMASLVPDGTNSSTVIDLAAGAIEIQQDGNEETGFRLRMRSSAGMPSTKAGGENFYVLRRGGKLYFAGIGESPETIGFTAMLLAGEGRTEPARTWLNWAREGIAPGGGDDSLAGPPFARIWPKEKATATADEIRIAAAALMSGKEDTSDRSASILVGLRDKTPNDEAKTAVDIALMVDYRQLRDWNKLLLVAEQLAKAHPDSGSAFEAWTLALQQLGRSDEVETLGKERLARLPKDAAAIHALADGAARNGKYDTAMTWSRRLVDDGTPTSGDYNNVAWLALFRGTDLDRAIDDARRASAEGSADPAAMNTLAALYAESGKTVEARQALLKSIDGRHTEEPSSADWFVIGRIAEDYGLPDAAAAAYKRVDKEEATGLTTWELAQRRMTAMGAL